MRFDLISREGVLGYYRNIAEMSLPKNNEYGERPDFCDRPECASLSPEEAYYLGTEHGETDMVRDFFDLMEIEYDKGDK